MAEEMERVESEFTYTYDQFTVFFYGDKVFVGGREYPIGQCCMDILNLDEAVLDEISQRVREFVPSAMDLLKEKTDSAAALAQERLNAVWELIFSLPVYRDLKMDEPCNYHTFQRLMADKEKWAQVQDVTSAGYAKYQGMLMELICFAEGLHSFRQLIDMMAGKYLEPLKLRNSSAYAEAYSYFYMQMFSAGVQVFGDDFEQGIPVEVSFVPMMHPTEEGKIFIAEKAMFNSLIDCLQAEFYRGLAMGERPRRCHKVGAHRKEAHGNCTPAQKEYRKVYNRLKARKQRGKISEDEWNTAVARAQELVAQSERGELSDEELKRLLEEL